jgi:hypothetical protein
MFCAALCTGVGAFTFGYARGLAAASPYLGPYSIEGGHGFSLNAPAMLSGFATIITGAGCLVFLLASYFGVKRPLLAAEHIFSLILISPAFLIGFVLIRLAIENGLKYP